MEIKAKGKGKVARKGKRMAMRAKEKEALTGLRRHHHRLGRGKEALRHLRLLRSLWGKERDATHHRLRARGKEKAQSIVHPRLRRLFRAIL